MLKKRYSKPEVLAPAGSMEALKAAIYAGADAVYVGGSQFGARAFADNFSKEALLDAIDFVHTYDKKIYMTVNTLLKEKEIQEELYGYLLPFYAQGLDAVIVQDAGVFSMVRNCFPDLAVHISTQMGVLTEYGANVMKDEGASRVVPGRELSLGEVKDITSIEEFETECFVHGALCYCYSGQCFLSSRIGGRSGNRGRCAQPCRLQYQLSDGISGYVMSPKDLCSLEVLPELIKNGVDSLKIEGRMKKPEYVSAVTRVYRKYVDYAWDCIEQDQQYMVDPKDILLLSQLYNRGGFTDGYWNQHNGFEMMSIARPNHNGVFVGEVDYIDKGAIIFTAVQDIYIQDVIELRIGEDAVELTSPLDAKKGTVVRLNANQIKRIRPGMPLFRMKSPYMIDQLLHLGDAKISINAVLRLQVGEPMELTYCLASNEYILGMAIGPMVEVALKQAATREDVEKTVSQFGGTDYEIGKIDTILDKDSFVPVKALKQLRRDAIAQLDSNLRESYRRTESAQINQSQDCRIDAVAPLDIGSFTVQCHTKEQLQFALGDHRVGRVIISYGCALKYEKDVLSDLLTMAEDEKQIYIALPSMFRKTDAKLLEPLLGISRLNGATVGSLDGLAYLMKSESMILDGKSTFGVLFMDTLYCYNTIAFQYWIAQLKKTRFCFGGVVAPKELSLRELKDLRYPGLCLPLYGHTVVMTSAQCVKKTLECCDHSSSTTILKDRKGKIYQLEHICKSCQTILREVEPLSLSGCYSDVRDLAVSQYYMEFCDEAVADMDAILENFQKEFIDLDNSFSIVPGNTAYYYAPID